MKNFNGIKLMICCLLLSRATTHTRTWSEWWAEKRPSWNTEYSWQNAKEDVKQLATSGINAAKNNKIKTAAVVGGLTVMYMARNRFSSAWHARPKILKGSGEGMLRKLIDPDKSNTLN